jgi:hypothetical protein
MQIQQFRQTVYQTMQLRGDATMDLIDALTVRGHVPSPVSLSEAAPFRRKFSMVYDVLENGQWDLEELKELLSACRPEGVETIAGYPVYALDSTENERAEAQTLPDRGILKADQFDALRFGHKYSWLMRLVSWGTSWTAPVDVMRVETQQSESRVGAEQVRALSERQTEDKVITADSLYANEKFLPVVAPLAHTYALVRMRRTNVLYERPLPPAQPRRGRKALHGARFALNQPARLPDCQKEAQLGNRIVRLQAWGGLHFKRFAQVEGRALRIEFLRLDGTPCYAHPMWLFWTGPQTVDLLDLCRMYLWRFAIEHTFRFLKQHLGLNANRSTNLVCTQRWMWTCALAYWQLLLLRTQADDARPAWYPKHNGAHLRITTPYLVQQQAAILLLRLGTPARSLRPAGKGHGRPSGYHPLQKPHLPIVKKSPKAPISSP